MRLLVRTQHAIDRSDGPAGSAVPFAPSRHGVSLPSSATLKTPTFSGVNSIYLDNYWGTNADEELIGFEFGAPPHVQIR